MFHKVRLAVAAVPLAAFAMGTVAVPAAPVADAAACSISVTVTHGPGAVVATDNHDCGNMIRAYGWFGTPTSKYIYGYWKTTDGAQSVAYDPNKATPLWGGYQWKTCGTCSVHSVETF